MGAFDTVDVLRNNVTRPRLSLVLSTRVERQVGIVTMHAIEATETGGAEVNVDVHSSDIPAAHLNKYGQQYPAEKPKSY